MYLIYRPVRKSIFLPKHHGHRGNAANDLSLSVRMTRKTRNRRPNFVRPLPPSFGSVHLRILPLTRLYHILYCSCLRERGSQVRIQGVEGYRIGCAGDHEMIRPLLSQPPKITISPNMDASKEDFISLTISTSSRKDPNGGAV